MRAGYGNYLKVPLARSLLQAGTKTLDVGCGPGRLMLPLVDVGAAGLTGIDTDVEAVGKLNAALAERGAQARASAQVASAQELPFEDATFDVVFCFSTLTVLPEPRRALSEIARVLRPGGRAVIDIRGVRNANHNHWAAYYAREGIDLKASTLSEARADLDRHGFSIDETHAYGLTRAAMYLPLLKSMPWIERLCHRDDDQVDIDYRLSNLPPLMPFAASWYFVVSKLQPTQAQGESPPQAARSSEPLRSQETTAHP